MNLKNRLSKLTNQIEIFTAQNSPNSLTNILKKIDGKGLPNDKAYQNMIAHNERLKNHESKIPHDTN